MDQKVMINIRSSKPVTSYGDGHILVFDKNSGCYFPETRETFLQPQNNKIMELEKKILSLETNLNDVIIRTKDKYNSFVTEQEEKYNDFLKTYKENNAKIIEMVKSVIEVEDK